MANKKIKEGLEIEINETEDEEESNEVIVDILTNENGEADYITPLIKGHLDTVIVCPEESPIYILDIFLNEYPEVSLFSNEDKVISYTLFMPLRVEAMNNTFQKFNFAPEKYCLNNQLYISVVTKPNSKIKLIFRCD